MILKEGGALVLTTPNIFFLPSRILFPFGIKPFFAWAEYHYHIYDIKTLSNLVKRSGFEIENIKSSHILISSRKFKIIGKFFEMLGNWFPKFGAHIILFAKKKWFITPYKTNIHKHYRYSGIRAGLEPAPTIWFYVSLTLCQTSEIFSIHYKLFKKMRYSVKTFIYIY